MQERHYLTTRQLAARYNRTTRTMSRWCEGTSTRFPLPIKINGRKLWDSQAIEAWEASLMHDQLAKGK